MSALLSQPTSKEIFKIFLTHPIRMKNISSRKALLSKIWHHRNINFKFKCPSFIFKGPDLILWLSYNQHIHKSLMSLVPSEHVLELGIITQSLVLRVHMFLVRKSARNTKV